MAPATSRKVPPETGVVGDTVGDFVGVPDGVVVALPQPARTMTLVRTSERIRRKIRFFTLINTSL
jgi:hypothetical protein